MRVRFAATLAVAAFVTVSCGGVVDPSQNVTDPFSGTFEPQPSAKSVDVHSFKTTKSGEFTVTITALAPASNIFVGTLYGQVQQDGSCGILQQNNFSSLNQQSLGGAITPGTWCVGIYDIGTLTAPETYTLTVKHP